MPTVARGPLALVAAIGCLLLAPPALGASAAQACPQLVDPRGDQSPATDPAADLRSVSLSATSRSLTLVIGYQGEQVALTPLSGHIYSVVLDTGEAAVEAWAFIAPSGNSFSLYRATRAGAGGSHASAGTPIGYPTGRVDAVKHTVHIDIPFAMAPDILRLGTRLTVTSAVSTAFITPDIPVTGSAFASSGSDESDEPAKYRLGSRNC